MRASCVRVGVLADVVPARPSRDRRGVSKSHVTVSSFVAISWTVTRPSRRRSRSGKEGASSRIHSRIAGPSKTGCPLRLAQRGMRHSAGWGGGVRSSSRIVAVETSGTSTGQSQDGAIRSERFESELDRTRSAPVGVGVRHEPDSLRFSRSVEHRSNRVELEARDADDGLGLGSVLEDPFERGSSSDSHQRLVAAHAPPATGGEDQDRVVAQHESVAEDTAVNAPGLHDVFGTVDQDTAIRKRGARE